MSTSTLLVGRRLPTTTVALAALAAAAWVGTIVWIRAEDMDPMPGTMGMSLGSFTAMWGLMMAAMMLPSVAPFVQTYQATVVEHRLTRLGALASGYLSVWVAVGVGAFYLAEWFGRLAAGRADTAQAVAVGTFAVVGVYQLTPVKQRCLRHCRSPIAHLMHYLGYQGWSRDVRVGAHHGWFCLGCCWALMAVMIAFGVMNVGAMVGLAVVIAVEKVWRRGEAFARVVGAACLVFAAVLVVEPGLAPGLDPGSVGTMSDMGM